MNPPHPTPQEIAQRAHEIYVANGYHDGHDVDDWLQAEYELLAQPIRVLATLKAPRRSRTAAWSQSVVALVQAVL
jgi:hypothetical protein